MKVLKRSIAVLLTAIFSFSCIKTVHADLYSDKMEIEKEILRIQQEIKELEKEQEVILEESQKINSQILDLAIQIEQAEKEIEATEEEIEKKEVEIEEKKNQLQIAIEERDMQYEAMKKRIQYFYEKEDTMLNSIVSDSFTMFLNNEEFVNQLYENDRTLLDEYIKAMEEVKRIKEEMQEKRKELVQKQSLLKLEKIGLEENKQLLDDRLAELNAQSFENLLDLDAYKVDAAALSSKLADISSKIAEMEYKQALLASQRQITYASNTYIANLSADALNKQLDALPKQGIGGSSDGSDIVNYANQFVGNPYVWGGNSLTNGIDCSHFVWNVLKDTGYYNGGYYIAENWPGLGESVSSLAQAKAGDVICYSGHVAIYDGNGKIIEAQSSSAGITNNRQADKSTILAIRRFTGD